MKNEWVVFKNVISEYPYLTDNLNGELPSVLKNDFINVSCTNVRMNPDDAETCTSFDYLPLYEIEDICIAQQLDDDHDETILKGRFYIYRSDNFFNGVNYEIGLYDTFFELVDDKDSDASAGITKIQSLFEEKVIDNDSYFYANICVYMESLNINEKYRNQGIGKWFIQNLKQFIMPDIPYDEIDCLVTMVYPKMPEAKYSRDEYDRWYASPEYKRTYDSNTKFLLNNGFQLFAYDIVLRDECKQQYRYDWYWLIPFDCHNEE